MKDTNLTAHMRMNADGDGTKTERPTLRSKSRGKDRDPVRAGKSMKFMNRVGVLREFGGDANTENVRGEGIHILRREDGRGRDFCNGGV